MMNLILIVLCLGIGFFSGVRYVNKKNYKNYKNYTNYRKYDK